MLQANDDVGVWQYAIMEGSSSLGIAPVVTGLKISWIGPGWAESAGHSLTYNDDPWTAHINSNKMDSGCNQSPSHSPHRLGCSVTHHVKDNANQSRGNGWPHGGHATILVGAADCFGILSQGIWALMRSLTQEVRAGTRCLIEGP